VSKLGAVNMHVRLNRLIIYVNSALLFMDADDWLPKFLIADPQGLRVKLEFLVFGLLPSVD
jgi:hypothetical protein